MFLQVSVILFMGGLPHCMLGYHPHGKVDPPCAVHAGRYGQQAGDMHPTGMQSCFNMLILYMWLQDINKVKVKLQG